MNMVTCKVCGIEKKYIKANFFKKCWELEHICIDCIKTHNMFNLTLNEIRLMQLYEKEINKKLKPKSKYNNEFSRIRQKVLKRDNYKCVLCGSANKIHVHHINERSKGGTNDMDNLITLCYECHKNEHKNEPVYKLMCKRAG